MSTTAIRLVLPALWLGVAATIGVAQNRTAEGHWEGKIQLSNREIGITVDLARQGKTWKGSITIVGSATKNVPLTDITVGDVPVKFSANLPEPTTFAGGLSVDGTTMSGTARNSSWEGTFMLTRTNDVSAQEQAAGSPREFEGTWEGSITSNGSTRRIGLKLSPSEEGPSSATFAMETGPAIPVDVVTIKGKNLTLEVHAVSGVFRGTLGPDGEIAGEWSEGENNLPLTFQRK